MNKVADVEPKVITNTTPEQEAERIQKSPLLRHIEKVKAAIFHSDGELRTSQAVMRKRVSAAPRQFDELLETHGGLQFQALLKIEHQPRFYHWIPVAVQDTGHWNAGSLLYLYRQFEKEYLRLRTDWTQWLLANRTDLTPRQVKQMQEHNKQLNLALRLVRPFPKTDSLWSLGYEQQVEYFVSECRRLKPLIEFFQP